MFLVIWLISSLGWTFPEVPKTIPHFCTPSSSDFKEFRYKSNTPYCERRVSDSTRRAIYASYGVELSEQYNYTIDHIVPLSLGGSNDPLNLWPQHRSMKTSSLEASLWHKVNSGELHVTDALNQILKIKFKK